MQYLRRTFSRFTKPPYRGPFIATALFAGTPIVILAIALAVLSVNAPFWDQWIYADLLGKLHAGTLTFQDLWHQHNEHRIFFPKVIQIGVATITQWNVRFEVVMNLAAVVITYGLLLWVMWRTVANRKLFVAAAAVSAWLLFSPLAYINWIWGHQFVFHFSVMCLAGVVWALFRSQKAKTLDIWFWVAVGIAILCTYSIGNGLLVWFAGGAMLVLYGVVRQKMLVWGGVGIAAIGLYFYHFELNSGGSLMALLQQPLNGVQYVLQYLGHPLGATPGAAVLAGSILLAVGITSVVAGYRQKRLTLMAPWIGLGTYGLLTALMAAATRLGPFGVDHSMSFSYVTISVLFTVGVVVIAAQALEASLKKIMRWPAQWLLAAGCVVGLAAYPLATAYVENYLIGMQKMREQSVHLHKVRDCIHKATSSADPCLLQAFPHQQAVWDKLETLKKLHINDF